MADFLDIALILHLQDHEVYDRHDLYDPLTI